MKLSDIKDLAPLKEFYDQREADRKAKAKKKQKAKKVAKAKKTGRYSLNTDQTAERLHVSKGRVRQFVQQGRLHPLKKAGKDNKSTTFANKEVERFKRVKRKRTGRPEGT